MLHESMCSVFLTPGKNPRRHPPVLFVQSLISWIVDVAALGQGDLCMLVPIWVSAYIKCLLCAAMRWNFPFEIAFTKVETGGKPVYIVPDVVGFSNYYIVF